MCACNMFYRFKFLLQFQILVCMFGYINFDFIFVYLIVLGVNVNSHGTIVTPSFHINT